MLNGVFSTGARIEGEPSAVLGKDRRWIAYRNLGGRLALRTVGVLSDPVGSSAVDTGIPISDANAPALAASEGQLFLAWRDTAGDLQFAFSTDGTSLTAPLPVGVRAGGRRRPVRDRRRRLFAADAMVAEQARDPRAGAGRQHGRHRTRSAA